jgi:hypothetical protein
VSNLSHTTLRFSALLTCVEDLSYNLSQFCIGADTRRFLEVSVSPQRLGRDAVRLCARGGHDDDRCQIAPGGGSQFTKDFQACNLRDVQVQQYECRTRRRAVRRHFPETPQGFLAISGHAHLEVWVVFSEYLPNDEHVRGVVLDQQYSLSDLRRYAGRRRLGTLVILGGR